MNALKDKERERGRRSRSVERAINLRDWPIENPTHKHVRFRSLLYPKLEMLVEERSRPNLLPFCVRFFFFNQSRVSVWSHQHTYAERNKNPLSRFPGWFALLPLSRLIQPLRFALLLSVLVQDARARECVYLWERKNCCEIYVAIERLERNKQKM